MKQRTKKMLWDIGIVVLSGILIVGRYYEERKPLKEDWIFIIGLLLFVFAILDGIGVFVQRNKRTKNMEQKKPYEIRQVLLLDETDKPIRCWEIAGRISLIIGKKNKEEMIDIDLEECEYSTLIEEQHAALNYCAGNWYIEDLSLENGVKIQKVEDGVCYKVQSRPCKVSAGDIIYIANTKLLLS